MLLEFHDSGNPDLSASIVVELTAAGGHIQRINRETTRQVSCRYGVYSLPIVQFNLILDWFSSR